MLVLPRTRRPPALALGLLALLGPRAALAQSDGAVNSDVIIDLSDAMTHSDGGLGPDAMTVCANTPSLVCLSGPGVSSPPVGDLDVSYLPCSSHFVVAANDGSGPMSAGNRVWAVGLSASGLGSVMPFGTLGLGSPSNLVASVGGTRSNALVAVGDSHTDALMRMRGTLATGYGMGRPVTFAPFPASTLTPLDVGSPDMDCSPDGLCAQLVAGHSSLASATALPVLFARRIRDDGSVLSDWTPWYSPAASMGTLAPQLGRVAVLWDNIAGDFWFAGYVSAGSSRVQVGSRDGVLSAGPFGSTNALGDPAHRRLSMTLDDQHNLWLAYDVATADGTTANSTVTFTVCTPSATHLGCTDMHNVLSSLGDPGVNPQLPTLVFDGGLFWLAYEASFASPTGISARGVVLAVGARNAMGAVSWVIVDRVSGIRSPALSTDGRGSTLLAVRDGAQGVWARLLRRPCTGSAECPALWRCARSTDDALSCVGPDESCSGTPDAGLDAGPDAAPDAPEDAMDQGTTSDGAAPDQATPLDQGMDAPAEREPERPDGGREAAADARASGHEFTGGSCQCAAPGAPRGRARNAGALGLAALLALGRRRAQTMGRR